MKKILRINRMSGLVKTEIGIMSGYIFIGLILTVVSGNTLYYFSVAGEIYLATIMLAQIPLYFGGWKEAMGLLQNLPVKKSELMSIKKLIYYGNFIISTIIMLVICVGLHFADGSIARSLIYALGTLFQYCMIAKAENKEKAVEAIIMIVVFAAGILKAILFMMI